MKRLALLLVLLTLPSLLHAQAPATPITPAPAPADSTPAAAPAQTATPPAYTPPVPTEVAAPVSTSPEPKRPWLVPQRPEVAIRAELDQQKQRVTQCDSDLLEANKTIIADKATLAIKKRELDALAERIKAAKKAKQDADRKTLEAERRKQETMATFFDRVVDMDEATIEDVGSRHDHAKASVAALELELQYTLRMAGAHPESDPQMLPLEQQVIQSQKDRASAQETLARKDQALADRRLRVYRAWSDFAGGR